jgi:hypothetical protein
MQSLKSAQMIIAGTGDSTNASFNVQLRAEVDPEITNLAG